MATSASYAHHKFYAAVLVLATSNDPLRSRLARAVIDHVRHAHPPFDPSVAPDVAIRADELFNSLRRGPHVDSEELLMQQTIDLMSEEEIGSVAAEVVWLFCQLAT